ncbi:putative LRR receptor-like serine/threonine-protein kinase [Dorcoceras hygrometricum]|uniref:non-specific serine/threonine protein kinase n=1 Tax=Dorcoceras hygrometricum TaxID=472368 RepID=A0A2Z7BAA9_9LAMI|nr:putative LRR receptor-like serine/threonine-protein kinase [Dorcoceras hygrometricum]
MGSVVHFLVPFLLLTPSIPCQPTEFISIDCGGSANYTDKDTGLAWISDGPITAQGKPVKVGKTDGNSIQYRTRRDFPTDTKKNCYSLTTEERRRYVVRATFLYGPSLTEGTYPKFQLYLDATRWSTITITEAARVYVKEMIIRAPSKSIDVCLCCATTGSPFISTLEMRPLNLSMYATDYEDEFFLKVTQRVNFGAVSQESIRYPDDPYDRIWVSDLDRRPNFLVGVAPGTERISTTKVIDINSREYPPVKVMQTAVVGSRGSLSYRLNLEDFPANARAYAYFAEIEDLGTNESRKFKMEQPSVLDYSNAVVNIAENANGSYTLYEPSYMNVTLEFVLSFSFVKTPDSIRGPLLNAIEISRYVRIVAKTDEQDVSNLNALLLHSGEWLEVGGDPCIPTNWEWLSCTSSTPPRITKIFLSAKKMEGEIPWKLNDMEELTELWLDGNSLSGTIPDMSNLVNLKILHLENNKLTGPLPSYLGSLPHLQQLHVQNNSLSGEIPTTLLRANLTFNYQGNPHLRRVTKTHSKVVLATSVGVLASLFVLSIASIILVRSFRTRITSTRKDKGSSWYKSNKPLTDYSLRRGAYFMDEGVACFIPLTDIQEATASFSEKIGKGSFGPVYYGKMKDGMEVAVKIMAYLSSHGTKQFMTEVALLSRIHHRNLVPLIGYYAEENQRMLVYEYMHNGTLRDHLHDFDEQKQLDWLPRLRIAEDAAKGLEYLHTGCNPSIIHRDVKTSNILLDMNMRAKVSDFGLSRQAEEELSHVSSVARGTVGYIDPEYYANQQLTEKSDVYSYGVVLLELISGRKPVSMEEYGCDWNIVHWARSLICKGDVLSIIDPRLAGNVKIESVWRIAEIAIQCVEQHGYSRPRMQEIIVAIQDAVKIESGADLSESSKAQSSRKTLLTSFLDIQSPNLSSGTLAPSAR